MRDAHEMQINSEELERMHVLELEWQAKEAMKTKSVKLLELLEMQKQIIERMIDICKAGEKI